MSAARRTALLYGLYYGSLGILLPYLPVFYTSLGASLGLVGVLAALSPGMGLVAGVVWGSMADRSPRFHLVVVAALGTLTLGAALFWFIKVPELLFVGVAVFGFGMGGSGPLIDSVAVDVGADAGPSFGPLRLWGSIGWVAAVLIAGGRADAAGIRTIFPLSIAVMAATALLASGLPRQRSHMLSPQRWWAGLASLRSLLPFLGASLLTWMFMSVVMAMFSLWMVHLGASPQIVGVAWALSAAAEVPCMLAFPRLARRFGNERLLVTGGVLLALRALGMFLLPDLRIALALTLVQGIAFALFLVGAVTYVSARAPRTHTATALGALGGGNGVGMVLGDLIAGGVANQAGIQSAFVVAGVGGIVAALLVWRAVLSAGPAVRAVASVRRSETLEAGER